IVDRDRESGAFIIDLPVLADIFAYQRTWEEFGHPTLRGRILVHSTNPASSCSAALAVLMLTHIMAGVPFTQALDWAPLNAQRRAEVLAAVRSSISDQGLQDPTSGLLFTKLTDSGPGSPVKMIWTYEASVIEYRVVHAADPKVTLDVVYTRPWVNTPHD